MLDDILDKIPETFNMTEIMAKAAEKTPYVVVAFQECERMNILTNEMRRSLKELNLGLKVKSWVTRPPKGLGSRLPKSAGSWPQPGHWHGMACPLLPCSPGCSRSHGSLS